MKTIPTYTKMMNDGRYEFGYVKRMASGRDRLVKVSERDSFAEAQKSAFELKGE